MHSGLDEDDRPGDQPSLSKPATLQQCHEVIAAQALQITQRREQMVLLQEQLKLDSRNSSKPPSSDGPADGNRAQRRASVVSSMATRVASGPRWTNPKSTTSSSARRGRCAIAASRCTPIASRCVIRSPTCRQ
jgi:hypothetical protein